MAGNSAQDRTAQYALKRPATNDMTVKTLICFGLGYTATALAKLVSGPQWRVIGTSRTPETIDPGLAENLTLEKFPDGAFNACPSGAYWLVSVPPEEETCPVFKAFSAQIPKAKWIGYLSSTGVYGDLNGGWAFEDTPVAPLSSEAKRRVVAETQWIGSGAHVFRLPGIYGPGRSAFDRLRKGTARRIIRPGQVFSRAHVNDIAALLLASMHAPNPGRIYNVSDDAPSPPQDVITHAAKLIDIPPPPEIAFEDAGLSPKAQRFYRECKRVSNARAKAELGWRPRYPDYRSGLAAVLQAETAEST